MYETATTIKKVAIYGRVSTDGQRESETIDAQIAEDRKFCDDNGFEVVKCYQDEGWSGGLKNRPALDELIEDGKKGLFQAVVINNIDRLARENSPYYYVLETLERNGIKVIFVKASNNDDAGGEAMRGMLLTFSIYERRIIRERTMRGKRHKLLVKKEPMGSIPAYGYDYITKNKQLGKEGYFLINESETQTVRSIFDWVGNEGLSAREVVRRLFTRGYKTRAGKTKWSKSTILRILKNEQYIGNLYYNRLFTVETDKHRTEQRHRKRLKTGVRVRPREHWILIKKPELAIIDEDLFYAAQQQIKQNRALCKRNSKREYLLGGGLIKCGKCGHSYFGTPMHDVPYYRDGNRINRHPEARDCFNKAIPAEKIEQFTWRLVVRLIKQPEVLVRQLKKNYGIIAPQVTLREAELAKVVEFLTRLEKDEGRVIEGYKKGFWGDERVNKEMQGIQSERQRLNEERKRLENQIQNNTVVKDAPLIIGQFCKSIGQKLNKLSFEDRKRVIRMFVKEIVFDGEKILVRGLIPMIRQSTNPTYDFTVRKQMHS